jgi:6-phosphogluconolactonase
MDHELVLLANPKAVAQEAAQRFAQWAQDAVAGRGRFRVALAGGGTPGALYQLLASEPYRSQIPWPQTDVFWGDERHLPAGDPGRNDTAVLPLLALAGIPALNVHPMPYAPGDPDAAARQYEDDLRRQTQPHTPLLDLTILGLGDDGHTASLFPGTPALDEAARLVVANYAAYADRHPERVTLTFPAINASAVVLFLVTGAGKRAMLRRVLGAPEDPLLPAQRVQPRLGRLIWLVDQAAASAA